ncbi:IclR family transcriptional regulator C-terminal domain-containing protein [Paraburkholderia sp. BL6665CI2N2]|uniref:IclR family transcriptional regulator domain-containing protein n=1 Tax=Paraburkholderia sp. BL6665CI2N2 TaxID=1938806 RepID=UPI001FB9E1AF|nr:IclR family transcriptional regulator C-terminal domain-containing protein [Paraburkholderia sp. BL6665CI2N2]
MLEVGSRRPLGAGAGGLAIHSAIGDEERAEIITRVAPSLSAFGKLSAEDLAEACEQSREIGAAVIQNRVTLGVRAVGVAFRDSMDQAVGALSVAALTQRLNQRRTNQVAEMLLSATRSVEISMRKRATSLPHP